MDQNTDSMHEQPVLPAPAVQPEQPLYISCSAEDLIMLEMEAWDHGFQQADADDPHMLEGIEAISQAAEQVCDQSLQRYVPLDVIRFRDVFTRAWSAGYCTGVSRGEHNQVNPKLHGVTSH